MRTFLALSGLAFLTACASSGEERRYVALDEDPRVGERQTQLCFQRTINGFSDYQRGRGIILNRGRDRYLVTFAGACVAARDALVVGLDNRMGGVGCLDSGDPVFLSDSLSGRRGSNPFSTDVCRVLDIYAYDADAGGKEADDAE